MTTGAVWTRGARQPTEAPAPVRGLRRALAWDGWITLGLEAVVLLSTVWSIEQAQWVPAQPSLTLIALLGMAAAAGLERLRLHAVLGLTAGLVLVGLPVVFWQSAAALPGIGWDARFGEMIARLTKWWDLALSGGISIDPLPFAVALALLTWALSFTSAWFLQRRLNMWWGILPAGFCLLTNLSYLTENYYGFFWTYLFAAMLIMTRTNVLRLQRGWRQQGIHVPSGMGLAFLMHAGWFSLLVVGIAWVLPMQTATVGQMRAAWETARAPWGDVESEVGRLFSSLPARKAVPLHTFGRAMPFRGAVDLGNEVALLAHADHAGYWRARVYDVYTSEGWLTGDRQTSTLSQATPGSAQRSGPGYRARKTVTQGMELNFSTDALFAQGQPLEASIPVLVETAPAGIYNISLVDNTGNQNLPFDLRRLSGNLQQAALAQRFLTREEVLRLLPPGVRLKEVQEAGGYVTTIQITRDAETTDVLGIRSPDRSVGPRRYDIVSSVSVASARELRAASPAIPRWVSDRYLQLPSSLPDRVRRVAAEVARNAATPYDRAVAIETYLRTIPQAMDVAAPPPGADGVDHFLFTLNRGYSDYHASTMVVLLRAAGVPARLAVGYATGQWDDQTKVYVVRERHAHAWPEVYFNGYGWVEFEPAPGHETFARGEQPEETMASDDTSMDFDEPFLEDELLSSLDGGNLNDFRDNGGPWAVAARVTGVTLIVALLALAAMWLVWMLSFRGLRPAMATYEKMARLAGLSGLAPRVQETPSEYAEALTRVLPSQKDSIRTITRGFERSQYGKKALSDQDEAEINSAWRAIRSRLLRRVLRRL